VGNSEDEVVVEVEAVVVEVEVEAVKARVVADSNTNPFVTAGFEVPVPPFVVLVWEAPVFAGVAENAGWGESVNFA